jgi:aminoglycoside 6'-N-acetyltransferase I
MADLRIDPAEAADLDEWAAMRATLWPEGSVEEHRQEASAMLKESDAIAFIAHDADGRAVAFAEASLRRDYVNGCDSSPVCFLEGIFVQPDARRFGLAGALVDRVRLWGLGKGCTEMASDAGIANGESHAFHAAIGFAETERVVYFRKPIG